MKDLLTQRDEAIAAVEGRANSTQQFSSLAQEFVLAYLREHGPASSETMTDACKESCVTPHDDRAFGGVYMRLARAGLICKVGTCPRRKGHLTSGGTVWGIR